MAPAQIRARLAPRSRPSRRDWLLTPVAAAVGAATHVLWDSFTHPGRWGPRHIEWLRADHGALPGLKWVQYASGVVGLTIVVWAAVRHLRSLETVPGARPPAVLPPTVLPAVVTIAVLVGLVSVARSVPDGFHAMAFNGVVDSLVAATALSALACAAWHLARRRRTPVAGKSASDRVP
ncbi:DUF4184 family protein [Nocardioides immobilis]|uniref:DUF4184 family protein n=1 Tax=Nocardioides immobilis TaxID=2049295 RepID=A0A417XZ67_9ACTN|nr:DUF4184 family protein [Nocardioides immobilis]